MAGHSKWANIKHKKAKKDQKKAKIVSRIIKEIIIAVKEGGGIDPKTNAKLRKAILKAKENNISKENIERNIKKASSKDQKDYFAITYEIYAKGGIGILADVITDNKNRTLSEIKQVVNKFKAKIAALNAVSFNFEEKGVIRLNKKDLSKEDLFTFAVENNAEDFRVEKDFYVIITQKEDFDSIKNKLKKFEYAEIEKIPKNIIKCSSEDKEANLKLILALEDIEDVDCIYHNMDLEEF